MLICYDPDCPPTAIELAYRRGYMQGAFATMDAKCSGVRNARICRWLDALGEWHREANVTSDAHCRQVPPPVLKTRG